MAGAKPSSTFLAFRGGPHPVSVSHFTVPSAGLLFTMQQQLSTNTEMMLSKYSLISAVQPTEIPQWKCRTETKEKTFPLGVLPLGVLAQVGFNVQK